ncbi:hypothetical protein ACFVMC_02460 [Nocardia sp. NPDC127579]|uniref:hypothetical protein n=1 Tax=Nocardia sp. NPDC127579 TaxID=3345402 RepID=UPI003627C34C
MLICFGLLLAACSSDEGGTGKREVMSEPDYPEGEKKMDIPDDQVRDRMTDVLSVQAIDSVTPADCQGRVDDMTSQAEKVTDKASFTAASGGTPPSVYFEAVSKTKVDLSVFREAVEKCPDMQVTSTSPDRQHLTSQVTMEPRKPPAAIDGVDAVAYRTTTVSSVPGFGAFTIKAYIGWAIVGDKTVAVRAAVQTKEFDEAAAEKFFVAAVDKARK